MSGRGGFLVRKVVWALVTIAVVVTFNFFLFRVLPGDPAKSGLRDPRLNPAAVEALRERFGLDKPVLINLEGGQSARHAVHRVPRRPGARRPRDELRLP